MARRLIEKTPNFDRGARFSVSSGRGVCRSSRSERNSGFPADKWWSASAKATARQPSLWRLACQAEALEESEGPCRGIPRLNLIQRIKFSATADRLGMVRVRGLEPPHREILEPKSSASTSSATPAQYSGGRVHNARLPGRATAFAQGARNDPLMSGWPQYRR
jgi:hypothetical protein